MKIHKILTEFDEAKMAKDIKDILSCLSRQKMHVFRNYFQRETVNRSHAQKYIGRRDGSEQC